jgi:hypothetical protein
MGFFTCPSRVYYLYTRAFLLVLKSSYLYLRFVACHWTMLFLLGFFIWTRELLLLLEMGSSGHHPTQCGLIILFTYVANLCYLSLILKGAHSLVIMKIKYQQLIRLVHLCDHVIMILLGPCNIFWSCLSRFSNCSMVGICNWTFMVVLWRPMATK